MNCTIGGQEVSRNRFVRPGNEYQAGREAASYVVAVQTSNWPEATPLPGWQQGGAC